MLFVKFHGGKNGLNNVYGFSTKDGRPETKTALSVSRHDEVELSPAL